MWFLRVWVPLALSATILSGMLYAVLQEQYRSSLNDPQIQMAEDAALKLAAGVKPASFAVKDHFDMATSLAPWIAIYDATGTPILSTAFLHDALPAPPAGVFKDLRERAFDAASDVPHLKEHRLTWEPEEGVRQAVVVVQAGDYFVVSGRNMREVEQRIWNMEIVVALGWVATMIASLVAVWLGSYAQDFITYARG